MGDTDLHEACGVFGCVATGEWPTQLDVAHTVYLGLVGLQHRGQESAGIVTSLGAEDSKFKTKKGMGLVTHIYTEEDIAKLKGNIGIGHTRYSTQGESEMQNIQPFVVETEHGLIAVAHNGELVNAKSLKKKLLRHGVGLSTGSDSELITQLLTHLPECGEPQGLVNWVGRIKRIMSETLTSYSLVIMHHDKIYALRDPFGNRPLCVGKLYPAAAFSGKKVLADDDIDGWVVSSESCNFNSMGARYYREVLPDSTFEGQMVYTVRQRCGRQLAEEAPVNVDIVSTVPESATPAALAYAEKLGIPYGEVFCKNRYIGRTFIQPNMRQRKLGVAKKFGVLTDNFRGKRVVLIDDSIVRGVTMVPIVKLLRAEGAAEIHIRIASPPIKYPCYMGINIPTFQELIANVVPLEDMPAHFGADSLQYLSVDGLKKAVREGIKNPNGSTGHCVACLTGEYPVKCNDW
ncbi:purF [Mytilus coruscus]|uniref:Amidophosphoribosyltransferase n=1 Tax=Mytilus coruscus TaxID=42192 RepID=A0A6J8DN30_MYTCO|nr:purF [Mytilus coruscus]